MYIPNIQDLFHATIRNRTKRETTHVYQVLQLVRVYAGVPFLFEAYALKWKIHVIYL